MAEAVTRRRRPREDDEDAEETTTRRSRDDADEDEERRPSRTRGRGELPSRRNRDEDDDEPTTRRRSSRDDDEEPEEPRRSRSRDDEEPEDKPRRRRSSEDDDEPPSRRRSSRDEDDEPPSRRRSSRDEDEDTGPVRKTKGGFASYKKVKEETSDWADDFKLKEEEQLVKFLEDEPFDTYARHWINAAPTGERKSWVCISDIEDCPLCGVGDHARAIALFNILVIDEEGKVKHKVLEAQPSMAELLEKASRAHSGPLSVNYYSLSCIRPAEGKKGATKFFVDAVRERDLVKEWGIDPLTDKELDAFADKAFGEGYVKFPTKNKLKEIARFARGDDRK